MYLGKTYFSFKYGLFTVDEIAKIGRLCSLTLPEMFKLVENQLEKQKRNKLS